MQFNDVLKLTEPLSRQKKRLKMKYTAIRNLESVSFYFITKKKTHDHLLLPVLYPNTYY